MGKKYPIDYIVGDVDSVLFLYFLLEEGRSKRMMVICSKDECFCFIGNWFWFSARLSWVGVKTVLFVK
jgi:hypothetical protein